MNNLCVCLREHKFSRRFASKHRPALKLNSFHFSIPQILLIIVFHAITGKEIELSKTNKLITFLLCANSIHVVANHAVIMCLEKVDRKPPEVRKIRCDIDIIRLAYCGWWYSSEREALRGKATHDELGFEVVAFHIELIERLPLI